MAISCTKLQSIELNYEQINLPTEYDVRSILMVDSTYGYAVGGRQFKSGFIAETFDAWRQYDHTDMGSDLVFDIACASQGNCMAVAFDSKIYTKRNFDVWKDNRLNVITRLASVEAVHDSLYMVVGGHSLSYGYISLIDHVAVEKDFIDSLDAELHHVQGLSNEEIYLCGYGIISQIEPTELSLDIADIQGDFFLAMDFPTLKVGYAVGEFGTIAKTTDGGRSWEKLRNGNTLFVKDLEFQDVRFITEDVGYVIGKSGLVWHTSNGGESWSEVKKFPNVDYYCVTSTLNHLYIGGSEGTILKIEI